jgi:SAM-dependent methyltransferase
MDLNYQPENTYLESEWLGYYKWTNESSEPWETLYKTVEFFQEEKIEPQVALDLGCGVGTDTAFLVENGWKVIAVDAESIAQDFLFAKVPEAKRNDITFVTSTYENFIFPQEIQIINASFALPFCRPEYFEDVMLQITSSISVGGRFCGHFFGPNDTWATDTSMVFLDNEQIIEYFRDFNIEYFKEEEKDDVSGSGFKHWHIYHIIAKKI